MSEPETPGIAGDAGPDGVGPTVTATDIDSILADFRAWLQEASATASIETEQSPEPVDLFTLVAQFAALRHEVNLQTRAVRTQQELNAQTLRQLEAVAKPPLPPPDPSLEPLLKALVEAADAQILAARELQRLVQGVKESLETRELAQKKSVAAKPTLFGRLLGVSPAHEQMRQLEAELAERFAPPQAERIRNMVESAAAGLAMGLQRLERVMRQHGLEPIPAVGRNFAPETMEAVEVALDCGRPGGEVVDELRRGYLWNGVVFRYAQVRVAK